MTNLAQTNGSRVLKPFVLSLLFIVITTTNGFGEKLGTIAAPPPSAKLRIFVEAISVERERGNWRKPHKKFEKGAYKRVRRVIADGTSYMVVPKEEVAQVIGKKERKLWAWQKNNWKLAIDAGKRLYAEYAMFVVRDWDRTMGVTMKFVLLNIETGKMFKKIEVIPRMASKAQKLRFIRTAFEDLNTEAADDLLATANRKGQLASQELFETKKEILALMADTPEKKTPAQPKKEAPVTVKEKVPAPSKKEASLKAKKETPAKAKEKIAAPQAETPKAIISKEEKVVQLEQRLAKLMETLSQLEVMKKQFEEQRKKSDQLTKELAERDKREETLLSKLEDSSKSPPVIVLASPKDNANVEFDFIHLAGVVEDEKGIQKIEFFVNDKPLVKGTERGLAVTGRKHSKRIEFKERVSLKKGLNRLKIRAVDSDGLFSEKTLSVHYVEKQKKVRAVVIGIDKYPHIRQLKYAVNDARIFYDHLVKRNRIPAENITLLLDQDATLRKIRSALGTELKNKAGKDDMVIIYFAGHGAAERDTQSPDGDGLEKYLLPYDADLKDLYATALPMEELSRIFSRIRSERLIYIADACYSGASGGRTIGVTGTRAPMRSWTGLRVERGV